eukprot:g2249.t1
MPPITVRPEADDSSEISESNERPIGVKKEFNGDTSHVELDTTKLSLSANHVRHGSTKLDTSMHSNTDNETASLSHRGVNHRPPTEDEHISRRKNNNSRNSNVSRTSEDSVRSTGGRRSGEGARKSTENSGNRKSSESQRSSSSEKIPCDDSSSDQLSQITDILLARLVTTLSDSTLGNPALLLQTLLGFSPDDYNDLLAALSESHLSYVDIISAYLHNIKVMSEDSGSTSAALSGTLTRSLIDQYNSLLAQAVKSPQSIARANLIGDPDGRSNLADLLQKANTSGTENRTERRSLDNLLPKGPSGLGFGRRHSTDASKQRQQSYIQGTTSMTDALSKSGNQSENGLLDLAKLLNLSKVPPPPNQDTNAGNSTGNNTVVTSPPTTGPGVSNFAGLSPEQLTALLQNSGMLSTGPTPAPAPAVAVGAGSPQFGIPTAPPGAANNLPFHFGQNIPPPVAMNGMLAPPSYPYGMASNMQPWTTATTVPIQQQVPVNNRNLWQHSMHGPGAYSGFRGWGSGLETVPENFNSSLQVYPDQQTCFPAVINLPQQQQQQQQQSSQQ